MAEISACIMDCPDCCSFVKDTKANTILGNPDHPFTRGFICSKGKAFIRRLNAPQRILTPMLRQNWDFRSISWDAALALVAERLNNLDSTPEKVLHIRGYGYRGVLAQASLNFFQALGSAATYGSLCDETGIEACMRDFGSLNQNHPHELLNASCIVNWGRDFLRSSPHTAALIQEARKLGTRVLSISPGGQSQSLSDEFILIRPGMDRFLAAAIIKMFIRDDLFAPELLELVRDWQKFRDLVMSTSIRELLDMCGVARDQAGKIFECYRGKSPVASVLGWGLQRYAFGGENVRFINALALLTGNIGIKGGGSYFNIDSSRNLGTWSAITPDGMPDPEKRRRLALYNLGREIENCSPRVEFIWVDGHNVINQIPDSKAMELAFRDSFVVCVDGFFNDTALLADLVLPPAFMMEKEDILGSCLHDYVNYSGKLFEPKGECLSDFDILNDLGRRLSRQVLFPDSQQCLAAGLAPMNASLEKIREKGFLEGGNPRIAFAGPKFDHPDGCYCLPEKLSPEPENPRTFPMRLLSLVRGRYMHSQIPESRQQGLPVVFISKDNSFYSCYDPSKKTWLVTALGRMQVKPDFVIDIHPEAVIMRRGGWMKCWHGPNIIVQAMPTDMGDGAAYYSQCCRLDQT